MLHNFVKDLFKDLYQQYVFNINILNYLKNIKLMHFQFKHIFQSRFLG